MIGRNLSRFAWPVLLGMAALTAFLGYRASMIRTDFTIGRIYGTKSPEHASFEKFREDFGTDDLILYVAFPCEDPFSPETRDLLKTLQDGVAGIDGVQATFSLLDGVALYRGAGKAVASSPLFRGNLFADDGRAACMWILLEKDVVSAERRRQVVGRMRAALDEVPGVELHLSGLPVVENEYVALTERDIRTFVPLATGIFILLLTLYYRNATGTLLPLVSVAIAIVWTLGVMQLLGFSMSILSTLIPELILIIGIADAVHLLTRHQEDLRAVDDRREALARTLAVMVPACFLTSFTTSAGFASLVTTGVETIQEFGLFCAAGIMIAYGVSVTFIPAALDRLPSFRGRVGDARMALLWDRVLGAVARINETKKAWICVVTVLAVALAVLGMTRLRKESSWLHDLRPENRVHRAHMFFNRNLTGVFSLDLRVEGPVKDVEWLGKVAAFQEKIAAWEWEGRRGIRHMLSYVDLVREMSLLRLRPRALPRTQEEYDACLKIYQGLGARRDLGLRLVDPEFESCRLSLRMDRMTSKSVDALEAAIGEMRGDLDVTITGKTWLAKKAMDRVVENMLWSLGVASLVIFGSMSILFRSAAVGLLSMIPNFFPMLFTAGFMGWMGIDLNFSTVTVFSIALGIAVDSTIHYLARLRLEVARDPEPVGAMRRAVRGAGAPIIFTTLLLLLGFGSILTSNFVFTFHFGLLGGFALLTALLGDLFVAPALFLVFRPKVGSWKAYNKEAR